MKDKILENDFNIRKFLFFAIILILFLVFLLTLLFNRGDGYLIIDETLIISKKWGSLKKINDYRDEVFNGYFHVVSKDGEFDKVIVNRSSFGEWNYMDNDYAYLETGNVSLAYNGQFKNVKSADYDFSYYDSSDDDILNKVLDGRRLSNFISSVRKSSFDVDGDGVVENIFTLTNNRLVISKKSMYSLIFMEKNGEIVNIDSDSDNPFMVRWIVDVDGDGKYEVVVSRGGYDVALTDSSYQIYKISGKNVKCIMNS